MSKVYGVAHWVCFGVAVFASVQVFEFLFPLLRDINFLVPAGILVAMIYTHRGLYLLRKKFAHRRNFNKLVSAFYASGKFKR